MSSTEVLARRRVWLLIAAAVGFQIWQVSGLVLGFSPHLRTPATAVGLAGFLLFAGALAGFLLWARQARGRPALEDEMTQRNRLRAFAAGFWAMLGTAAILFVVGEFVPVRGVDAARLVMIAGVVLSLLCFASLEEPGER